MALHTETQGSDMERTVPARLVRALELVYAIEGVIGARIWQWSGGIAVGIALSGSSPEADTLRRVELAVAAVRRPDETWSFGLLGD